MTKKFIHTNKEINGNNCKNEFLIPDIFENKTQLIGMESGKSYEFGIVVFTGVEMDETKIINKLMKFRIINTSQKEKYLNAFNYYLLQIKEMKIGKIVRLNEDFKLVEK